MDIEKMYEGEGGYVFVSHSHLDLKEVREVRNYLETSGLEPILFYLRSMENCDEDRLALLRKLIYEEIDSREFFLYLESENSKNSQWVQEEIRYVNEKYPDKIISLPLSQGADEIKKQLQAFVKKMRVFISYSRRDTPLVERLKTALVKRDFRVYANEDVLSSGASWGKQTKKTIKDISKEGSVIVVLTEQSMQSVYIRMEFMHALRCGGRIIPIVVGDVDLSKTEWSFLIGYPHFRMNKIDSDEEIEEFVNDFKKIVKEKTVKNKK